MKRKTYTIAAVALVVAGLGIGGFYYMGKSADNRTQEQQLAERETEKETESSKKVVKQEKETEETAKVSAVLVPKKNKTQTSKKDKQQTDTKESKETAKTEKEQKETKSVSAKAVNANLHFDTAAGLLWPVDGAVIIDYSMDKTTYFTTLDQYKYNPAVIISGNVNEKVKAAASGKITAISTNEVTGCTVTMDIGDGYSAIYGQLKEVPYEVGAYIEAGNTIGFISEPTKYYSLEGSNVYFELQKDGEPMDPIAFFQ